MFGGVAVAAGLLSGPAWASGGNAPDVTPLEASLTGPLKQPKDIIKDEVDNMKSEAELKAEERKKALAAMAIQDAARVIVLRWPSTDTDYKNLLLQRTVKSRIARPNAKFYPEIDLYQPGRREPDRNVRAMDQRATVPDSAIATLEEAVAQVETIPWNGLSEQDWQLKAQELLDLLDETWFIDRVELRESIFRLYVEIGKAAENGNIQSPPFYQQVGKQAVNYYWFLAAAMAFEQGDLLSKLTDEDSNATISRIVDEIKSGEFPQMTLSFQNAGEFDVAEFGGEYEVFINGLPKLISDPKGLIDVPAGRVDVYLKRTDGHSLSDKVTLDKLEGKVYGVRDSARQKMGDEFIRQLMVNPNECIPVLDGDILDYLSIYSKLHGKAMVYIAIPEGGSVNKVRLWRWVPESGTLQLVQDEVGGFPVRFAALIGTGMHFGTPTVPSAKDQADAIAKRYADSPPPTDTSGLPDPVSFIPSATFTPSAIPIDYNLRLHAGHLMMELGMTLSANPGLTAAGVNGFQDVFPSRNFSGDGSFNYAYTWAPVTCADVPAEGENAADVVQGCKNVMTAQATDPDFYDDVPSQQYEDSGIGEALNGLDENGLDQNGIAQVGTGLEPGFVLRQRNWQRLISFGIGGMLGKEAALGFGPRGFIRTGFYNAPLAWDLTGHLGYALEAPFSAGTGRVRPMADAGVFGGVMIPMVQSILHANKGPAASIKGYDPYGLRPENTKALIHLGVNAKVGLTF